MAEQLISGKIHEISLFLSITSKNEARISYKKAIQGWELPRIVVERHTFAKKNI